MDRYQWSVGWWDKWFGAKVDWPIKEVHGYVNRRVSVKWIEREQAKKKAELEEEARIAQIEMKKNLVVQSAVLAFFEYASSNMQAGVEKLLFQSESFRKHLLSRKGPNIMAELLPSAFAAGLLEIRKHDPESVQAAIKGFTQLLNKLDNGNKSRFEQAFLSQYVPAALEAPLDSSNPLDAIVKVTASRLSVKLQPNRHAALARCIGFLCMSWDQAKAKAEREPA